MSRQLIDQTVSETIKNRNWDFYRDQYLQGSYSHSDLVDINNIWYDQIHNQIFFHSKWAINFFNRFKDYPHIVIHELGCYRGELANIILNKFNNILLWCGFDICSKAVVESQRNHNFFPVAIHRPFWELNISKSDIFVSTHTLEHFSTEEVYKILDVVTERTTKGIWLEMPIKEDGKIWRGGASSHVLQLGRKHFRKYFVDKGWHVCVERDQGMNWGIGVINE